MSLGHIDHLKAALSNMDDTYSDLLVMLGDLPDVKSDQINRIIEEHILANDSKSTITIPTFQGKNGNPVIWGRAFFHDLSCLEGDTGGRLLFSEHPAAINIVEMQDPSVITDIDTPIDFENWERA